MTTSRHNADTSGRKTGKKRATSGDVRDPLYSELGVVGRQPYPLEPARLAERSLLISCAAVEARVSASATPLDPGTAAALVLREIINSIRDKTDHLVAEAMFATDKDYEGQSIGDRQEVLYEKHGISENVYAEHRPTVINLIIHELKTSGDDRVQPARSPMPPLEVRCTAHEAAWFYSGLVAARVRDEELARLRQMSSPLWFKPKKLEKLHINFLLRAHFYLYSGGHMLESGRLARLRELITQIEDQGPAFDITYLTFLHTGKRYWSFSFAGDDPWDRIADEYLEWYNAALGTPQLRSVADNVRTFRQLLPTDPMSPDDNYEWSFMDAAVLNILNETLENREYKGARYWRTDAARANWSRRARRKALAIIRRELKQPCV